MLLQLRRILFPIREEIKKHKHYTPPNNLYEIIFDDEYEDFINGQLDACGSMISSYEWLKKMTKKKNIQNKNNSPHLIWAYSQYNGIKNKSPLKYYKTIRDYWNEKGDLVILTLKLRIFNNFLSINFFKN